MGLIYIPFDKLLAYVSIRPGKPLKILKFLLLICGKLEI